MNDPLAILFENQARIKLLRFFLFNTDEKFAFEDITRRARLVRRTARTEVNVLLRAKIIKKCVIYLDQEGGKKKLKVEGLMIDRDFPYLLPLIDFFQLTAPLNAKMVLNHLNKAGKFDVVVSAGVFVHEPEQRIDLLLAMKNAAVEKIETAIRGIESELGMDIRFTLLETSDLQYRLGMYDKHTRDVFDFKHEILVDKINLSNELSKPWTMR